MISDPLKFGSSGEVGLFKDEINVKHARSSKMTRLERNLSDETKIGTMR
jgi:hypothetical protein